MSVSPPLTDGSDEARKSRLHGDSPMRLEKHTVILPGKETLSRSAKFWLAYDHVKYHVLVSSLIAVALIVSGTSWDLGHFSEVLIHMGAAFLISAIVVFGYELGTKTRQAEKLTLELVSVLYKHGNEILDASSVEAIRAAMTDLCRDQAPELSEQFAQFALAVGDLAQGGWAGSAYVKFVAAFHRELTNKTERLANVNRGSSGAGVGFDMPDAVLLADNLVGNTMARLMQIGGEYDAVSDVFTWKVLTGFQSIQNDTPSVKRRRLFVLGLKSDKDLAPGEVRSVIYDHYSNSREHPGTYEMRITTLDEYRKVELIELHDAKHCGIFVPDEGSAIAFLVIDESVAHFRLTDASPAMRAEFDRLWLQAEPLAKLDPELAANVINDYLSGYFIARMPRNGHYRGFSRLSEWLDGKYDRMFKASVDTMDAKHIHIKRIFVLTEGNRNAVERERREIENLFRRHFQQKRHSKERYEWRLCLEGNVSKDLLGELPFALIESSGDDLTDQLVLEVAQPQRGFRAPLPGNESKLSELFDALWSDLAGCEDSVRAALPDLADTILRRT